MLIAGHQPNYLPNLDYFAKMAEADRFVVFTNAQFNRREWQRRNRIPRDGKDIWLSVGVRKAPRQARIHEIRTDESSDWRRKHQRHLQAVYGKTREQELLAQVLAQARLGKSLEETKAAVDLAKYKSWGQFEAWSPLNIEGAYNRIQLNRRGN